MELLIRSPISAVVRRCSGGSEPARLASLARAFMPITSTLGGCGMVLRVHSCIRVSDTAPTAPLNSATGMFTELFMTSWWTLRMAVRCRCLRLHGFRRYLPGLLVEIEDPTLAI